MTIELKISLLHALGALLKPDLDATTRAVICAKIATVVKSINMS